MLKQVFQGNGLRKEKEEKIFPVGNRENSTFLWTLTPSALPPPPERVVSVILSLGYFCSFNTLMCQRENLMPMGRNSGHSPW